MLQCLYLQQSKLWSIIAIQSQLLFTTSVTSSIKRTTYHSPTVHCPHTRYGWPSANSWLAVRQCLLVWLCSCFIRFGSLIFWLSGWLGLAMDGVPAAVLRLLRRPPPVLPPGLALASPVWQLVLIRTCSMWRQGRVTASIMGVSLTGRCQDLVSGGGQWPGRRRGGSVSAA